MTREGNDRSDPFRTGTLRVHASHGFARRRRRAKVAGVTLIYVAAACLVVAQVLGVYGLISRKADLIFSLCMITLLVLSFVFGALGAYQQLA